MMVYNNNNDGYTHTHRSLKKPSMMTQPTLEGRRR
jgi:hypothetical protein